MTSGLATAYKQFSDVVPKISTRIKKGKNLFDLVFPYKNYAVGERFTRKSWKYPEPCYWTLTSVRPTKNGPDMKRGKAWGVLTWRGVTEKTPRMIRTPVKRDWMMIKAGEEPPTFELDKELEARRYNYFEAAIGEATLRRSEGASRVYTATLYGVAEEVKPILAPWKIQNFTAAEALHEWENRNKKKAKPTQAEETAGENAEAAAAATTEEGAKTEDDATKDQA